MHPLTLIAPAASYVYVNYLSSEKAATTAGNHGPKNAVWPKAGEVKNPALWAIVAVGAGGVVVEQLLRRFFKG